MARSSNKYKGEELGENLYYGLNSGYAGTGPVDVWYKGEEQFDYKSNRMKERTGHFTQLVWKNTKEIRCGIFQDVKVDIMLSATIIQQIITLVNTLKVYFLGKIQEMLLKKL